jgi:hypothetical protein
VRPPTGTELRRASNYTQSLLMLAMIRDLSEVDHQREQPRRSCSGRARRTRNPRHGALMAERFMPGMQHQRRQPTPRRPLEHSILPATSRVSIAPVQSMFTTAPRVRNSDTARMLQVCRRCGRFDAVIVGAGVRSTTACCHGAALYPWGIATGRDRVRTARGWHMPCIEAGIPRPVFLPHTPSLDQTDPCGPWAGAGACAAGRAMLLCQ